MNHTALNLSPTRFNRFRGLIDMLLYIALAILLVAVAEPAPAQVPTHIGKWQYKDGWSSIRPFVATEEEMITRVVDGYLNAPGSPYCAIWNIRPSNVAGQWRAEGFVDGVSTAESRTYSASYSLKDECKSYDNAGSWWGGYRERLVCSSTQRFFDPICVNGTYVDYEEHGDDAGPPCNQCPAKAPPPIGKPINPNNGNMWHEEFDYAQGSPLSSLSLTRTYNSQSFAWTVPGALGQAWEHNYSKRIVASPVIKPQGKYRCWVRSDTNERYCQTPPPLAYTIASATVYRGGGKGYTFNAGTGLAFTGPAAMPLRLVAEGSLDADRITGWVYTDEDKGETERYSPKGLLLSITSRVGRTDRLTYSPDPTNTSEVPPADSPACNYPQTGVVPPNALLCVTDHDGRQLNFHYDSRGRIVKMIDPTGAAYLYEYDGSTSFCAAGTGAVCEGNVLTKVTYPDGKSHTYAYNEPAQINGGAACPVNSPRTLDAMTGLYDENDARHITWAYNCAKQAVLSTLPNNVEKVTLSYITYSTGAADTSVTRFVGNPAAPEQVKRLYKSTVILGRKLSASIDAECDGCGSIRSRSYDANGNLAVTQSFDYRLITRYTYDLARNLQTRRVEADDSASKRTISTEWHPTLRLVAKLAEPKRITEYAYDANGLLLSRTETATTDLDGSAAFTATKTGTPRRWTYTYDTNGQLRTVLNPGDTVAVVMDYDSAGNLISVKDQLNRFTTYSQYDPNGRVGKITYPNGLVTEIGYDLRGRPTSQVNRAGTDERRTSYYYHPTGLLSRVVSPDGAVLNYTYDDAHRLTGISDGRGNTVAYTLDLTGNRIKEEVLDSSGTLAYRVTQVFNSLGQLTSKTGGVQ